MIDIETLGTRPKTAIVSVGVCTFNKNKIIKGFHCELDLQQQLWSGRTVTADTLAWFMGQPDGVREVFKQKDAEGNPKRKIKADEFFIMFDKFIEASRADVGETNQAIRVWGNGAHFDITILEDYYDQFHHKKDKGIPWKFWGVWCFRTFNHLTNCKEMVKREGTHHNALDDAIYQAKCVMAVLQRGGKFG